MNTQIKCYLLFLFILLANFTSAQESGNDRMKRDIEVAENILETLIQGEQNFRINGSTVEGSYIDGHGILFTLGSGSFFAIGRGTDIFVAGQGTVYSKKNNTVEKSDSIAANFYENIKTVMKTFITDYAHLLSQLKPNEKVLLRYGNSASTSLFKITTNAAVALSDGSKKNSKELTAEITKAALDEARAGKLTKTQLEERIKFSEQIEGGKRETDLELLSSIFNRLYQGDLSTTYRLIENTDYEKIEGLGAIYKMSFGYATKGTSSFFYNSAGGTVWSQEGLEKKPKVSEEEWKKEVTEKFPQFLEDFKKNLIEYGRTVKNLNTNELLAFNLRFHFCDECNIPKKVELSVKKSVLEDYDKNKISLSQAVEKITVKETRN